MQLIKMHMEYDHQRREGKAPSSIAPTKLMKDTSVKAYFPSLKRKLYLKPLESPKTPCPNCNKLFRMFSGRNVRAYDVCLDCFRAAKSQCKLGYRSAALATNPDICGTVPREGTIAYINADSRTTEFSNSICGVGINRRDHPRVTICVYPEGTARSITVEGIADTGAQTNIWGMSDFKSHGLHEGILKKIPLKIHAANKQPLNIAGGFEAKIEGVTPGNERVTCNTVIFVSKSVTGLFVSFDTLIKLRAVSSEFPIIGTHKPRQACSIFSELLSVEVTPGEALEVNSGCLTTSNMEGHCSCPQRAAVPLRPTSLPFVPLPENCIKMKAWLLEYFKSSTFNTCPHQPLQQMAGPPIEIHISDTAEPKVCKTPGVIALHWQKKVQDDIRRDEALGILERVPYGVPVTWCHRLVVTRKHDGTPRRTVDLSPLNKYCKRETHGAESPYHLARRIPPDSWKTVSDAWNGYHSVPLRESDRHLTTFITPFGRWRYTRAPQGYLSSGDGYNRRFAAVLDDFHRKERCVDDTIHYDTSLEEHWWRTIDFLIKVGQAGIVLNPKKFQFCLKDVEFAGFRITSKTVEPLPKYIKSIQMFPTPKNITDIKSWFGLVNQVSSYGQLRDIMSPFRRFLSPKVKFEWDSELQMAFDSSKLKIVETIQKGVRIFETDRWTCLRPDWSQKGIGYFLMQKHCLCVEVTPGCCDKGWKTTLAGSRFLSRTESRYAAIEGEALAIVWGLEQTKYFTQGCDKLLVVTDHKPLVKVFGDRTLDEVTNTRLFRLKQRTMLWNFSIEYMPGITNKAADAASRYPVQSMEAAAFSCGDLSEQLTVASICRETSAVTSISWDAIVRKTDADKVLVELKKAINENFCGVYSCISEYTRFKDCLFIQDGAVMYKDRVIIPTELRPAVLETLHAAHQGTSSMQLRAQKILFWPGMSNDIERRRAHCLICNQNAPSQSQLPSNPFPPPSTPFQFC